MLRFILRRTLGAIAILLVISAVTFFLFYAIPRNPALLACGKGVCTQEQLAVVEHNLGIDKPVPQQYIEYMSGLFIGRDFPAGSCPAPCLGFSFRDNRPVLDTILDRLPTTVSLTVGGALVFLVLGLAFGMLAAARRGTLLDKTMSSTSLVLSSMQIYFLGPLALAVLVHNTQLLPQPQYVPISEDPWGWFQGLLLPWLVLSTIFTANYTRLSRATLIEQLQEDHVRTAKAKGMAPRTVFFRYAWRGSLIPIVTIFGIDIGSLFGGAMITEYTFSLHGLGRLAVESVTQSNLPMLMGVMLFAALMIVLFNIVIDACYALIDPRVRLD
ncbi:ABC transporter permease [Streptomyces radicis]|uniref:ABC transporter permease n=1 Tax=Streptomyces radicis TaxID=1750517 RepID=A0A3A9WHY5_9ACTN|nr:ABC transporter permease [Streptomyces radicis]RKN09054.1 ABC transporter permease [Streptomyces radicis]RKN22755.1 ABC transporter permease [Streptomyces radicis]